MHRYENDLIEASKKRQAADFHKNINERFFGPRTPPRIICIIALITALVLS